MAERLRATGLNATLVLVRHGESAWIAEGRFQGRQDPALSALGERQAALVGARLAQRDEQTPLPIPPGPPLGVWHSPLTRAAATAQAIAAAQSAPVALHIEERLTEIAQGEWEGMPHAQVRARWPAELDAWRHSPLTSHAPGGEALVDAARRVAAALSSLIGTLSAEATVRSPSPSDQVGDVASIERDPVPGYPGSAPAAAQLEPWAVLVAHDGIFRLALMTLLDVSLERFWSFPFNLCAITVVALHEGVPTLRAHNLSEHLAPLAIEARAAEEARGDRRGAL